jgi:prepilin-type N-terminal cleavage/methylation domain-containing protein
MKTLRWKGFDRVHPARGRRRANDDSLVASNEQGFTLIELLIVVTILPLIVGALSVGLMSVFSLQSSVSNRLANTSDSQVVASTFLNDTQSAQAVTIAPGNGSAQCGPGTQLLGLEWNQISKGGSYNTVVSYVDVPNGSTYSLVRQYCTSGFTAVPPVAGSYTSTVVAYNVLQPCTAVVTTNCQNYASVSATVPTSPTSTFTDSVLNGWVATMGVAKIQFALSAPSTTETNGTFAYTLSAVPIASASVPATGTVITPASTTGCHSASPGTGYYASTLCLVDFSSLTGNNMLAAQQGCLQTAVPLPGGATLYFCLGLTGVTVKPSQLPTWSDAFLGNSCTGGSGGCTSGTPFYTGISGKPALYQTGAGTSYITFSKISVVNAQGVPATGWQVVSADAESTDNNESITWTSNTSAPLTILPNYPGTSAPVAGNACNNTGPIQPDPNTVSCIGGPNNAGLKTGTTMVAAATPTTLTVKIVGGGLQAAAFGLMLSGAS